MQAAKLIPIILIGGILLLAGVFYFVPGVRPGFVQGWFEKAKGYTPATSAEDALDKLRKAIEKREYEYAKLYLAGDFLEQFEKGRDEAGKLAGEITNLRANLAAKNIKSNKVEMVLYWLDPFPPFKYEVKNTSAEATNAVIHWNDDAGKFNDATSYNVSIDNGMRHALLPVGVLVPSPLPVTVKQTDGVWKVHIPVQVGDRHMRVCVQALDKHAGNVRNSLQSIGGDVKRDATTKADLENSFKAAIEKAFK